jgi:hypothetical protein
VNTLHGSTATDSRATPKTHLLSNRDKGICCMSCTLEETSPLEEILRNSFVGTCTSTPVIVADDEEEEEEDEIDDIDEIVEPVEAPIEQVDDFDEDDFDDDFDDDFEEDFEDDEYNIEVSEDELADDGDVEDAEFDDED